MSFSLLTWGVKASFLAYVQAAEGSIVVADGAACTAEGAFTFPALPDGDLAIAEDGSATGATRFRGSVTLEAHGGMLRATLSDLAVEAGKEGLVLTATQMPMGTTRCAIARLGPVQRDGSGGVTAAAAITLDGMYQIAENYPPGTALDPVRLA